jgi:hypothetical protein
MNFLWNVAVKEKEIQLKNFSERAISKKDTDNRFSRNIASQLIKCLLEAKKKRYSRFTTDEVDKYVKLLITLSDFTQNHLSEQEVKEITEKTKIGPFPNDARVIAYGVAANSKGPLCYCHSLFSILFSSTRYYGTLLLYLKNDSGLDIPVKDIQAISQNKDDFNYREFELTRTKNDQKEYTSARGALIELLQSMQKRWTTVKEFSFLILKSTTLLDELISIFSEFHDFNIGRQQDPYELFQRVAYALNAKYFFFPLCLEKIIYSSPSEMEKDGSLTKLGIKHDVRTLPLSFLSEYTGKERSMSTLLKDALSYTIQRIPKDVPKSITSVHKYSTYIETVDLEIIKLPSVFMFNLNRLDTVKKTAEDKSTVVIPVNFSFDERYKMPVGGEIQSYRIIGIMVYIGNQDKFGSSGHYISYFRMGETIFKFNDIREEPAENVKVVTGGIYNGIVKKYTIQEFEQETNNEYRQAQRQMTLAFFERVFN